jgi:hypothetical protein
VPTPSTPPAPDPTAAPPAALAIAAARTRVVGSDVTVEGTVTAQAGRILGDRTLVLQDASGGLPVRLPAGGLAGDFPRGTIMRASGTLAQPYGNLELRVREASDVTVIGSGGLPEARTLSTSGLREANEGLLATLTATIESIDRYSSGAVSIGVRDPAGSGKVYAFAPVGLDSSSLQRDQRVRATGVVGQRASSSGAADGHRLWIRSIDDLTVVAIAPTPVPTDDPGGDGPVEAWPRRVRIAEAAEGQRVAIVGVVTSKAGLIDPDGRRVAVQDGSGAILVRYPAGSPPARVGSVIRAVGEVGTWYGARQLEAEKSPRRKRRGAVRATPIKRPPAQRDEWRLVRSTVRITDVERDGDTWRAEAELANGSSVPIVGLAGSGIDGELLEPGRTARVTGLVKRAHPSATDQRFSLAPRSRKDIRLGRLVADDDDAGAGDDDDRDEDHGVAAAGGGGGDVLASTLGSLDGLEHRLVRVGGRVEAVADRRLTIDDGTAQGSLRLADAAGRFDPAIRVGEIVNAVGRVRRHRQHGTEVVVGSVADVRRAARLGGSLPTATETRAGILGRTVAEVGPLVVTPMPLGLAGPIETTASPLRRLPLVPLLLVTAVLGLVSAAALAAAGVLIWRGSRPSGPDAQDVPSGVG